MNDDAQGRLRTFLNEARDDPKILRENGVDALATLIDDAIDEARQEGWSDGYFEGRGYAE